MNTSAIGLDARITTLSAPARSEFGHDHYAYQDGQRLLIGTTRTLRPLESETGSDFRHRINAIVAAISGYVTISIEVDEEIRAGVIVQATIRVRYPPEPAAIRTDARTAGGRPAGPRGSRARA
ncbi:hypothetical protein K2Z83_15600 [Oscillochloris sp. ZM17-4]|uniref:hypothetical protein n=1 Tax=Oscillochloris sp. ZM17-4 TaxID=2866714 RepID=UPI001C72AF13|nr:hypothetical protein [Oscillochloris sp. ZM17-4]MBX0329102.1 hypothetical protein [Oscillochloris sp. ZM17-4]